MAAFVRSPMALRSHWLRAPMMFKNSSPLAEVVSTFSAIEVKPTLARLAKRKPLKRVASRRLSAAIRAARVTKALNLADLEWRALHAGGRRKRRAA